MSDRAGLLRAILEAPADDAPRLIFADWLEEKGWVGDGVHLRRAVQEKRVLARRFNKAIGLGQHPSAPTPAWARSVSGKATLRRGFVEQIRMPAHQFATIAGPLFSTQPVIEVDLTDVRPRWSFWAWGWQWESDADRRRTGYQVIPAALYDCLDPRAANTWASGRAAFEALAAACVRFGRRSVGLSSLDSR